MNVDCKRLLAVAGSALAVAWLSLAPAQAAVVYTQTIVNPLATVSTLDSLTNCRDSEGCLGRTGLVFDSAGNPLAAGNLTDTNLYTFTLTPADITAVNANPGGTATVSMTAARDLGLRAGTATNTDFLVTSLDGTLIGDLFGTTVSTCPAGENSPINFACGPNFHNDVTAISSLDVSGPLFQTAAADGLVNLLVNPTDDVGRLKVFSLTLQYAANAVPEGSSIWLLGIGMAGLAVVRRRKEPRAG
jgi:hypothetical protein